MGHLIPGYGGTAVCKITEDTMLPGERGGRQGSEAGRQKHSVCLRVLHSAPTRRRSLPPTQLPPPCPPAGEN